MFGQTDEEFKALFKRIARRYDEYPEKSFDWVGSQLDLHHQKDHSLKKHRAIMKGARWTWAAAMEEAEVYLQKGRVEDEDKDEEAADWHVRIDIFDENRPVISLEDLLAYVDLDWAGDKPTARAFIALLRKHADRLEKEVNESQWPE
jgi:hypothetical protein